MKIQYNLANVDNLKYAYFKGYFACPLKIIKYYLNITFI